MLQQVTKDVAEEAIRPAGIQRLSPPSAHIVRPYLCVHHVVSDLMRRRTTSLGAQTATYKEIPLRVGYAHQVHALHQRVELFSLQRRRRRHSLDHHERVQTLDTSFRRIHALQYETAVSKLRRDRGSRRRRSEAETGQGGSSTQPRLP